MVKRKTADSRFHRAFRKIAEWCRLNRHLPIGEQYQVLWRKLHGHFAYYGIIGNVQSLQRFRYEVIRVWRKWLSRRDREGSWPWARMNELLRYLLLPVPKGWVPPLRSEPVT